MSVWGVLLSVYLREAMYNFGQISHILIYIVKETIRGKPS